MSLLSAETTGEPDALTIGRRVRQLRVDRGYTLEQLGQAIGRAPSQVSVIENGRREVKLSELQALARVLEVKVEELLRVEAPSKRAGLEIALARAQRGPLYTSLALPELPIRKALSDEAIETILGMHDELQRLHRERAATPEEARRANTELRASMRSRGNYFAHLEVAAKKLLDKVGHTGGPFSQRVASDLAAHLGFTIHFAADVPSSTRSITDLAHGRIYLPVGQTDDARTALLQALAGHVLKLTEPTDYAEFLRQRVDTNYLAAALLVPEASAVRFMAEAKENRELSVEDLRDEFAVSYETAAHRFTNLVTEHLDIPVHFLKVHESGTISKAYENDNVLFPTDVLGAVEGQIVCRQWSARRVFDVDDRFSPYHQYTDKPVGTYWCTSRIQSTAGGDYSVSVGTPFASVKWFRGRDTTRRHTSLCPDESCCRRPPADLAERWAGHSRPSARLNSSLLAAMPAGVFPGVDSTEVYRFLDAHAPRG